MTPLIPAAGPPATNTPILRWTAISPPARAPGFPTDLLQQRRIGRRECVAGQLGRVDPAHLGAADRLGLPGEEPAFIGIDTHLALGINELQPLVRLTDGDLDPH